MQIKVLPDKQRLNCGICHYQLDPNNESAFVTFNCNLRVFADQQFKVWRCPHCQTIHCLEQVDLDYYYAQYPYEQLKLTPPLRLIYGNLFRRLTKHGFSQADSLLDYGCGKGLFIQYLRERGFTNCYGYDPYAPPEDFGDPSVIQGRQFDYILLSDVIEHVEDPYSLIAKLDHLLAPGGLILIGTPNAAKIDLTRPDLCDYYNEVHVPYHLHLYTRQTIEVLGIEQRWQPLDFYDRAYYDVSWFGLNARAWNEYQRLCDGTIDAVVEDPIDWGKALSSPKFWFYGIFGYWLSLRTGMDIMFRKVI